MPAQTDSSHPPRKMTYIYVYWDDSNVFISAKDVTMEKEGEETRPREDSFCQPGESGPQSKKCQSSRFNSPTTPETVAEDGAGGGVITALRPHQGRWGAASPRHDASVGYAQ